MNSKTQTFAFIGLLAGLGLLGTILPDRAFSETENRYLAKRPKVTWEKLVSGKLGSEYDKYLSDQFPGRDGWVRVQAESEKLFGKKDINGVYLGKDGYYIEKFDTEDLDGPVLYANLEKIRAFALDAAQKLGENHVRMMLVPSASEILKDKLPFAAAPYDQGRVFGELFSAGASDPEQSVPETEQTAVWVPVEEMLSRHSREPIYYRTDHHWTSLGAYYGYQAWAESLGLKPWEPGAFDVAPVTENFLGTIASKLSLGQNSAEPISIYQPKRPVEYEVFYDGGAEGHSELYSWSYLDKKDKYSVFLDGNHGLTEIRNNSIRQGTLCPEGKGKRLLIIKDSFAHSMAPFLANHFETVYMVDLRYFNMPVSRFMEESQITDVLVLYQIPGFAKEKSVANLR
ncbi:MAG: DHHW family protein [Lachnospiraceae bacterium]|nr:DHHW family protein [Lachnospiraceae bacterium]